MKKSIRDIKNGLQNFARNEDEGLSKKQLLFKKCAIINTHLYQHGNFQHQEWKNANGDRTPRELIQFLEGVEAGNAGNGMVIELCSHLIDVLEYLMDDRGVVKPPKYGLAVRKPTEALHALINQEERSEKENEYELRRLNDRLLKAAEGGKLDEVKSLVELGVNVNCYNGRGETPLMEAANWVGKDRGGVSVIQYLLSQGADINATDDEGYTALQGAICYNNVAAINVLLDAGADVNIISSKKWKGHKTPTLMLAVERLKEENAIPVIKALIDAGADVNAVAPCGENEGETALIMAVKRKDKSEDITLSIVKTLVEAGADVTKQGPEGTALDIAVYEHKSGVVKYLLSTEGAGSLREITYDQFEDFWADCEKEITEYWGRPIIKSMSFPWKYEIVVSFNRVAQDIISDVLRYIKRTFKEKFGYEPKHVTYNNAMRIASIYTI